MSLYTKLRVSVLRTSCPRMRRTTFASYTPAPLALLSSRNQAPPGLPISASSCVRLSLLHRNESFSMTVFPVTWPPVGHALIVTSCTSWSLHRWELVDVAWQVDSLPREAPAPPPRSPELLLARHRPTCSMAHRRARLQPPDRPEDNKVHPPPPAIFIAECTSRPQQQSFVIPRPKNSSLRPRGAGRTHKIMQLEKQDSHPLLPYTQRARPTCCPNPAGVRDPMPPTHYHRGTDGPILPLQRRGARGCPCSAPLPGLPKEAQP